MVALVSAFVAVVIVLAGVGAGFLIGLMFYSSPENPDGEP